MDRLDALTVRKVGEKSYWTRLGVAFKAKNGDGWNLVLDAMPASEEGQYKIYLMAPRENNQQSQKPSGGYSGGGRDDDPNRDIPFGPEMR